MAENEKSSISPAQGKEHHFPADVLSAEPGRLSASIGFDPVLTLCGVSDTACRRTLVGSETLRNFADLLRSQGLAVKRP